MSKRDDVKLPPLPKFVESALGPVAVHIVKRCGKKTTESLMGRYGMAKRVIEVSSRSTPIAQWQTLFHEQVHMAMFDAGLHNAFSPEQQEVICDTIGTARAVEIREAARAAQSTRNHGR